MIFQPDPALWHAGGSGSEDDADDSGRDVETDDGRPSPDAVASTESARSTRAGD